jgi:glutaredoxin 3
MKHRFMCIRKSKKNKERSPLLVVEQMTNDCMELELKGLLCASTDKERNSEDEVGLKLQPTYKLAKFRVDDVFAWRKDDNAPNAQPVVERNVFTQGKKLALSRPRACNAVRRKLMSQMNGESCVVYTNTNCNACTIAKGVLSGMGAVFSVVELDKVDGVMNTELVAITGLMTVPQVFVGGKFIGGCREGGLGGVVSLSKSGELLALLVDAGAIPHKRVKYRSQV